jgi:predicted double-glycine peptidase
MMLATLLAVAMCAAAEGPPTKEAAAKQLLCGSNCLYVALRALDAAPATAKELRDSLGDPKPVGYSLLDLQQCATQHGLNTLMVRTSLRNLASRPESFVCITSINNDHFVILYDISDKTVSLIDPPRKLEIPRDTFEKTWDRAALLLSKRELMSEERLSWRNRTRDILTAAAIAAAGIVVFGAAYVGVLRRVRGRSKVSLACWGLVLIHPLLMGCDATACPGPGTSRPRIGGSIQIRDERVNLGDVRIDGDVGPLAAQATITNVGHDDLVIHAISPSCDCLSTRLSRHRIPPGGSSTLKILLKPGTTVGPRSALVSLRSSDALKPEAEIRCEWTCTRALSTSPATVDLPSLRPGQSTSRTIDVLLDGLRPCRRCQLKIDGGALIRCAFEVPEGAALPDTHENATESQPHKFGRLALTIPASKEEGFLQASVELALHCEGVVRSTTTLPIRWRVTPLINVRPPAVYLGRLREGQTAKASVTLAATDGRPFVITDVDGVEGGVLAGAEFGKHADLAHNVNLEIQAPDATGLWSTTVRVSTDRHDASEIPIKLTAFLDTADGPQP